MHSSPLAIRAVLWNSLRVFGAALPALTLIALSTAAALVLIAAGVISINWGFAYQGGSIDPRVLAALLNGREFAVLGAGLLLALVPLSYFVGASVHAAADPAASLGSLLKRVKARGLQLFWLQWLVNILSARYSPFAALLLWFGIAAAIPVAVLENAGPMEAIERHHALAAGHRVRMYALVVFLTIAASIFPLTLGLAIFGGTPTGAALPPLLRLALAVPTAAIALVPAQLMFVALTRVYLELAGRAALHVPGAASVNP